MKYTNDPVRLGATARIGSGFILLCAIVAVCAIAYFMITEGATLFGIGFIAASFLGCYLFAYMAFKGQVPPMFRWLE